MPLLTSYFEDELQKSYSNRKEQVKSYFANIVFKFENYIDGRTRNSVNDIH